jgi:hypothetical protein
LKEVTSLPRKLEQADADMIRLLHGTTSATVRSLAAEYKVHADTIRNVVSFRSFIGQKPRKDRKYDMVQVREMKRLKREEGHGARKITRLMGLPDNDRGNVEQILNGETYKDVR